ncbi:MAG: site-2 protease family protein, partial [Selenomonadaceae bacterium]|nr:site-2 protease family protein [Selenomonadaceae bacterium]
MILTIAAAVFVFGLLVLVHEFGHFITAKMTGMRVDEFAIGFGPKLISKKHGETVYSLRAVPLGGFNDIAGMDPDNNTAGERGFCAKPVLSRMVVILAGSTMNFILP